MDSAHIKKKRSKRKHITFKSNKQFQKTLVFGTCVLVISEEAEMVFMLRAPEVCDLSLSRQTLESLRVIIIIIIN